MKILVLLFAALLVAGCATITLEGEGIPLPFPDPFKTFNG